MLDLHRAVPENRAPAPDLHRGKKAVPAPTCTALHRPCTAPAPKAGHVPAPPAPGICNMPMPVQVGAGRVEFRPYQEKAIADLRAAYAAGAKAPLLVMPTGGGKTICFAAISASAHGRGKRVLVVAHRRELIKQASTKLAAAGVPHGIIAPGYPATDDLVHVGSVQTLARRLDRLPSFDLVVLDEAHHAVAGQWKALLAAQRQAKILGMTATPERADGRGLGRPSGGPFDRLVLGPSVAELIAGGFLVGTRTYAPAGGGPDLRGVKTRLGDFDPAALAEAMDRLMLTGDAVAHYARLAPGLPAIAFCASVKHARDVAAAFQAAGWRAVAAHGAMPKAERDAALGGLETGAVQIVCSCSLIDEGLDVPRIGAVIDLAPTKSLARFLQRIGRGLRPAEGKQHLVVLDHAGNTMRHGLAETPRVWSLNGNRGRRSRQRSRHAGNAVQYMRRPRNVLHAGTATLGPASTGGASRIAMARWRKSTPPG